SVVGSVSGAQADATVGAAYANTFIEFLVNDGATDFVVNDVFDFTTTQSTTSANDENWTELYYDDVSANRELILKGTGLTRLESIYVGFSTYQSEGADYYNLVAASFTGYIAGDAFFSQPGVTYSGVPAHNNRIDYWLSLNGQHIKAALRVGTPVYESLYVGKFLPYARPSQFPHPIVNCGMLTGAPATRFSDTAHYMPYRGSRANMKMRDITGTWVTPAAYPYVNSTSGDELDLRDTGGYYHLTPVELFDYDADMWGALDGIFHITGFNNAVENTITIGGIDYIVIQDVYRTGFDDYYAIRMDL
ncbi:MAG: hypothetical protein PF495_19220, partial [Spirochaetales bacterium]|nr:hypothetical protein [Spirochaetales bacterium]